MKEVFSGDSNFRLAPRALSRSPCRKISSLFSKTLKYFAFVAVCSCYVVLAAPIFPEAHFKVSNTNESDEFGQSEAISGDTLVIVAPHDNSISSGTNINQADNTVQHSGAAYVFTRHEGGWTQQANVKASNTGAGDCFGYAVAISGDTIAVAASQKDSSEKGIGGSQFTVTVDDGPSGSITQTVEALKSYQVTPSTGSTGTTEPAIPVVIVDGCFGLKPLSGTQWKSRS